MASVSFSNWSRQGLFNRPIVSIKSHLNCLPVYSKFFRPITNVFCFTLESNKSRLGGISNLLRSSRPLTVIRGVISVIVDSVKLVIFCWSPANIFKEVDIPIFTKPFFTDPNTTTSVSVVPVHRRISASPNHGVPCTPLFGSFTRPSFSMFIHSVFFSSWHRRYIITQQKGGVL